MIKGTQTPINKEELKKLNQILQQLIDSNDSLEFRQPVDHKTLGLHDYLIVVKKPMDLGTCSKKLQNSEYKHVEECLDDIQLIWDNCKLYNGPSSWISKLSEKLEKSFKKYVKNYLPLINLPQSSIKVKKITEDTGVQEDTQQTISHNEKVEFSNNLKQLNPDQIGGIVQIIQTNSPSAFIVVNKERFQIVIDNIDFDTFVKCQNQIQTWMTGEEVSKRVKI
ncbi:unnamed protein product (macronuclear) [Paramecium tetraurelia]|uniref:Bromo domain-containing protein n=1 Tax=Paramecium tetraurelia TaxID=5888 RepID=A0EI75_PARTE|nr:uncharacterized protein GSPATT00027345001 [Paramecium tetraurelia]CAK95016.1 unnamed protein product [Paramecium tetraurelia]|eukprot:XP_001462389.1 hypothetical protein (macronuclear) [Paramecium tetraurelia strain d4-2]